MPEIGQNLAHYTLAEKIGKGGMGEVFRAKDQKLGRDVAIKVLPEEFARDTERVARFQREAKLLASLNHPNIASIYGLEESEGTNFLVLELVEGDTLSERLKVGPIPVEESLKLASQIAEALEAAHEKGVIHRDLKPSNIKVTPEGKVKVLDFGLAKAFAGDQEEMILSDSPTISAAATQKGVILGTAAYMSPEQAKAKTVDKRADIWAFGAVLFEMLTGRAAFSGKDVSDILAAVIRAEPEWNNLPANLHGRLKEVLERCLEKEARDRYHDIADVRVDIRKVLADPSGVFVQPIPAIKPRRKLQFGLPWVAAIFILGLIIAGVAIWNLKPTEPLQVSRSYYELPKDQQFGIHMSPFLAVSPDGKQFAYSASGGLYLRSMDELGARHISGTDDSSVAMFFSPDGKWIGYWSQNDSQLKKIAISGGAPVTIANADNPGRPVWYEDDTIVYSQQGSGIMRVSANGGTPETIIKAENDTLICPQILPDGKSVLFTSVSSQPYKIMVQSLKSGDRKELFEGDSAQYLPTGHIVYALENNLFAIPFDLDRLEAAGGPVPIVEGVFRQIAPQYALSESGTLVYVPGTMGAAIPQRTLVWVDRQGKEEPLSAAPNPYFGPRISPDGKRLALTSYIGGNIDIWIWDFVRETMTRLTFDEANDLFPLWTPDGQRIVFASNREPPISAYWKAADGTGKVERISSVTDRPNIPASWSSDGNTLVLMELASINNLDIGAMSMGNDKARMTLLQEKYLEAQPRISPDGRWMAYISDESGQNEVYVRPFPEVESGGRWQVSTNGGDSPLWSPDGRELFYRNGDAVMVVSVKTEPTFSLETPTTLFSGTYVSSEVGATWNEFNPWDIHPDGKRFLMIKPLQATDEASTEGIPRKINIVLNWLEELKERVPVK
jgi:serine/threonine protein kinase